MKNENNFFVATKATWKGVKPPSRICDYRSTSGSKYWYTSEGVYRESDHWSHIYTNKNYYRGCIRIASCYWTLKLKTNKIPKRLCGYTNWSNFRDNVTLIGE